MKKALAVIGLSTLLLAGCGGGGDPVSTDTGPKDAAWVQSEVGATTVAGASGDTFTVTIPVQDNLTRGLMEKGFWADAGEVIAAAQQSTVTAPDLVVKGTYELQDTRGNSLGDQDVIRGEYSDFRGINVENVADFKDAADATWLHPAFQG